MQNNEKKRGVWRFASLFTSFAYAVFWILIIYGFDLPYIATLTLLSAAVHELGHILALTFMGKSKMPTARSVGLKLEDCGISYTQRFIVCLAGPLTNLVLGILVLLLFDNEYTAILSALNFLTAISNLLPIRGTDGYNAIQSVIFNRSEGGFGIAVLEWLSLTFVSFMVFLSFYSALRLGEGYWMCALLTFSLLGELESVRKRIFRDFGRKNEIK